jgi:SAM-dependent methyltransferase
MTPPITTSGGPRVRHRFFAPILARIMQSGEEHGQTDLRRENLAGLKGRVLELGAGTGLNFPHYGPAVTEVIAAEPEPYMRARAEEAAAGAPVKVTVVDWPAEAVASDDGSFDAGVACLVLCCVRDQRKALAELFRVIRPGGELRYFEHIRADTSGLARLQVAADRIGVSVVTGNEHFARRTDKRIREAGFAVERERRFRFAPGLADKIAASHVIGLARRPA